MELVFKISEVQRPRSSEVILAYFIGSKILNFNPIGRGPRMIGSCLSLTVTHHRSEDAPPYRELCE